MTNRERVGIRLDPLDVLFFRGGRPFGPADQAETGLPMPQTLFGAVWTALIEAAGENPAAVTRKVRGEGMHLPAALESLQLSWLLGVSVRGPWFAREIDRGWEPLVPAPAILHSEKKRGRGRPIRLKPLKEGELPGWSPQEGLRRPLWHRRPESTEPVSGFLGREALECFLKGGEPESILPAEDVFGFDRRVGIGICPDRLAAEEGRIYGASFLSLRPGAFFYAEVDIPAGKRALLDRVQTVAFGGEGKRAKLGLLPRFEWPEISSGGKPLALLTTPGLFDGPVPASLRDEVVAAAVPGHIPVSGWDLARGGPKPARFAAAPGSVFFLDRDPNWPQALADAEEDRNRGWGCYLKGVWIDD